MFGIPLLYFPIFCLLASTGQMNEPISMIVGSNDAFSPEEEPSTVSRRNFESTGSESSKTVKKAWSMLYSSQSAR
jgi:hypothetical protein